MKIKENTADITDTASLIKSAPVSRVETFILQGKEYAARYPKARDMIEIEKIVNKKNSSFEQTLQSICYLTEGLDYETILDEYYVDLIPVFDVFNKIMNDKNTAIYNQGK